VFFLVHDLVGDLVMADACKLREGVAIVPKTYVRQKSWGESDADHWVILGTSFAVMEPLVAVVARVKEVFMMLCSRRSKRCKRPTGDLTALELAWQMILLS
jgi:hypothetical protein